MEYKYESEILAYLRKSGSIGMDELARALGVEPSGLMRPAASLEEKGLIKRSVSESSSRFLSEEGKRYEKEGLPEIRAYSKALAGKTIGDLAQDEKAFGLKWAKSKGLLEIGTGGALVPRLRMSEAQLASYSKKYLSDPASAPELLTRGLLSEKSEKSITLKITEKGSQQKEEGQDSIAVLTKDMLLSGSWKGKSFKKYDVNVPAEDAHMGRLHPLSVAITRIKQIFAEMGFEEMEGSHIESAFWNFDALFQPQDHPARELADTFYLEGEAQLPAEQLVERVKKAHEKGWKYQWSESEAKRRVLRTHTTATSARYLAAMKSTPKKYFSIGRVFRNEATDYKHLAEFHQVEGIVAWENATFRDLLGLLKEFYSKLGFKKVKFRPSYFPYTEPSLEIIVYFEPKKEWVEMGGAGIMRPEVSIPLANTYPVLAWGLSLERPLMMMMGITDIRTFYKNDLEWLENAKVKL